MRCRRRSASTAPAASCRPATRSIREPLAAGECFIAIQGPNFDGHEFIGAALKQGAALVIARADTKSPIEPDWPVIRVDDTLVGLAATGELHPPQVGQDRDRDYWEHRQDHDQGDDQPFVTGTLPSLQVRRQFQQ